MRGLTYKTQHLILQAIDLGISSHDLSKKYNISTELINNVLLNRGEVELIDRKAKEAQERGKHLGIPAGPIDFEEICRIHRLTLGAQSPHLERKGLTPRGYKKPTYETLPLEAQQKLDQLRHDWQNKPIRRSSRELRTRIRELIYEYDIGQLYLSEFIGSGTVVIRRSLQERDHTNVLNDPTVQLVRYYYDNKFLSTTKLAKLFGVSVETIRAIGKRMIHKNVPERKPL